MRNLQNERVGTAFWVLSLAALSFFVMTGCGVKAAPVPPGLVVAPAVKDLGAAQIPEGVRLAWTMPGTGPEIARIQILRSELAVAEDSCPGCPRAFKLAAEPRPRDLRSEQGSRTVVYVDREVSPGLLYTYTIRLCDASGFCSPESNKAEVKFKPVGIIEPGISGTK